MANRMRDVTCPLAIARLGLLLCVVALVGCSSSEQRAQNYYQDGMKFLAAKENAKAIVEFRNALDLDNNLMPAWRALAAAERAAHDAKGLAAALRSILGHDPADKAARVELGKLLLASGAADQALKLADELGDSRDANILGLKALVFAQLKDEKAAIREAQAALAVDPTNLDSLKVLAIARLEAKDPAGALQIVSRAHHKPLSDFGFDLLKIQIYQQLRDSPALESLLRELVQVYPREIIFRKKLVELFIQQHRVSDAEGELRTLLTTDPTNAEAEIDLVHLLETTKGTAAALEELKRRINTGGDVFAYEMALADLDYKEGNDLAWSTLLKRLDRDAKLPQRQLAVKMKLAEFYAGRKEFDLAEPIVSEVIRDDSFIAWKSRAGALKLRALIRLDNGHPGSAANDLMDALNAKPGSADLMVLLGIAYERTGAVDLAEKQYAEAFKASNSDPSVGVNYAEFLRRHGDPKAAEDVLTRLARQPQKNVPVLVALARLKIERQDWVGAEEVSETIRHVGGKSDLADEILGQALAGQQKFEAGIAALRNATAEAPSALEPMRLLVEVLTRAKQIDQAISFLHGVLNSKPGNAEALVLLGNAQLSNNATEEARQSFKKAIEVAPEESIGYRALADLYLRENQIEAAKAVVQSGLARRSNGPALHMILGAIREQAADYEGAISEYEKVLKDEPGSVIAANNLASLLADHHSDKDSIARAQSLAARLRQLDVPQFEDTLGWVSYRSGDIKTAVPLLKKAAAELPDQAVFHYHLGMSYLAIGERSKAADELGAALRQPASADLKNRIEAGLAKLATR